MGKSKLSKQDKIEIHKLRQAGEKLQAIATKYDVSVQTVLRVLSPERYAKHMERAKEYNKVNSQRQYEQNKITLRRYYFSLNKETDFAIVEKFDSVENITDYIRKLVLDDINKDLMQK